MSEKKTDKKVRQKLKKPNSVTVVMYAFSFLFLGMIGYLTWFVGTQQQPLLDNSYNSRQEILAAENYRGSILASGGEVLAQTAFLADGTEVREYPYGEKFAHVVGYSTQGRTGVESQANYYLINSNISLPQKIANGVDEVKNPGDTVLTTLDVALQEAAYKAIDTYRGAIIVTEVSTGKVLAMVSKPDFNPNEIVEIWGDLVEEEDSSVLLNRATQGLYPPGSTFKIITSLAYIRQFPDAWKDYDFDCNGQFKFGEESISCFHGIKHDEVDFITSFAKSCNSSFANIGMQLDRGDFSSLLTSLLFNKDLPVAFNYARSQMTVDADTTDGDMMQTVIGQGKTLMTPLHLHMITQAVANGGVLMNPYVVDQVVTDQGSVVKSFYPTTYGRLMSVDEANILTEAMQAVVEEGTATRISGLSYTVAGKTGSAEYSNVKGESHAWFTGFAPAENPEICVTIILEGAGSGGDYAVPMAKRVFNAWFDR